MENKIEPTSDFIWDNYSFSLLRQCPRLFQYRRVFHLVPREVSETAAQFGIGMHKALDVVFTGASIKAALKAFQNHFEPLNIASEYYITQNAAKILAGYANAYGLPEKSFEVVNMEQIVKKPLFPEMQAPYVGRIDKLVKFVSGPNEGEHWAWDHKTTTSPTLFVERPNHQFTGYVWLYQQEGIPVKGVVADILGVYSPKTKTEYFTRRFTERTPQEIEEWKALVWENWDRVQFYKANYELWPQYDNACSNYRGCVYRDLCLARDAQTFELLQQELYEVKPWEEVIGK